jgi:anti-sigma factor RsiW
MNPQTQAQIDQLISRQLDGELPENERALLWRQIMRDPAARTRFERLSQIDESAGEALRQALDGPARRMDSILSAGVAADGRVPGQLRRSPFRWAPAIAATAAALIVAWSAWWVSEGAYSAAASARGVEALRADIQAAPSAIEIHSENRDHILASQAAGALLAPDQCWAEPVVALTPPNPQMPAATLTIPTEGRRRHSRTFVGVFDAEGNRFLFLEVDRDQRDLRSVDAEL